MKYLIAILVLFAFTTEMKLKAKTQCRMGGEKCTFNAQCCGNRVCLSKKGKVCGPHLNVGEACGEDGECGSPNFCYSSVYTAPFESGHKGCGISLFSCPFPEGRVGGCPCFPIS